MWVRLAKFLDFLHQSEATTMTGFSDLEERRDLFRLSIPRWQLFEQRGGESGDVDEESPVLTEEKRRDQKCSTSGADFRC